MGMKREEVFSVLDFATLQLASLNYFFTSQRRGNRGYKLERNRKARICHRKCRLLSGLVLKHRQPLPPR